MLFFGKGKNHDLRSAWHSPFESERAIIVKLLEESQERFAVEIGAFYGNTTVQLATVCEQKGIELYVIDPWVYQNSYFIFKQNTKDFDCINVIKKKSVDAISDLSHLKNKCGFVFVDGDHSYQMSKFDMVNYFPLLADGGVLVVHDLYFSNGVRQAFEEFTADKSFHTFKHEPSQEELVRHHSIPNPTYEGRPASHMGLGWVYA